MRVRRSPAVATALVVLAVAGAGAALARHTPRLPLAQWAAIRRTRAERRAAVALGRYARSAGVQ
jgi:hypothetical protein